MSTDPETTDDTEPGTPDAAAEDDTREPVDTGETVAGETGEPAGRDAAEAGGAAETGGAAEAGEAGGQDAAETGGAESRNPAEGRDAAKTGDAEAGDTAEAGGAAEAGEAEGRDGTETESAAGRNPAESRDATKTGDAEAGDTAEAEGGAEAVDAAEAGGEGEAVGRVSEAEAELAAQRIERERIERRKAAKSEPIAAGAKLSGKAADLLAAVRAVESGRQPVAPVFAEPAPARRRPAPEPTPRPQPTEAAPAPSSPAPETVAAVRRVLTDGGAPDTLAPQVATALGEGAEERLRADPWQLLRVAGVRPEQADGFARALLGAECGPDDERRGRAVTGWLLEQAALAGHTALEMPALVAALAQRGVPDAEEAVHSAVAEGEALVFQDALDPAAPEPEEGEERPVRVLVGLERYALAEESLADGLARLIDSVPKEGGPAERWEEAATAVRGSAAELVRAAGAHGLVLHTGGEASLADLTALLRAADGLGLRAWAATHTPLGRDRFVTSWTGTSSTGASRSDGSPTDTATDTAPTAAPRVATVAGLLSGAEGPGRDAEGALDLDLLVVLDAPQLDVEAAALLVESLPDGARLVLAGDPAVLWSAGPGRVFADLLAARACPQVASRVPDSGPLGELVSGIGVGELNKVDAPGKEVVIVPVRDAGEAVHRTVQLVADSVPRAIGVPPEQTQVITPGHGGAAGTRALNAALKERLNPGPGRFGGFDPGDRVAYSPAPGRTLPGQVVKADADGLHLSCGGASVVVPKERVDQSVRHGWALTAHQAVGNRWPAVVVVLPGDAAHSLSRPWVYTAFGRAERHLSVVHGVDQALPRAVAEVPAKPRTTRLPVLLRAQLPATG
ncbi:helix-hairpin-helix domain-containing protein [Streptomyces sp. NPDC020490]|uniref:helix-hairpin-helix domain-containing protein n=1 Tax=Streptomyces sp. NPDC020490 TaxID=3365078 RepID=UPI0037A0DB2D